MTTSTMDVELAVPTGYWTRARKTGAAMTGLGVLATVLFGALASSDAARFAYGETVEGKGFDIPGNVGAILFGLIAVAAGLVLLFTGRHFGLLVGTALLAFIISALCWQMSVSTVSHTMPLGSIAAITFTAAIPFIFGSLGGVLCERTGVVNVAIEGQLLTGAFFGSLFGTVTGSFWLGLVAAMVGGALLSAILAVFAIKYLVDQVVVGIVLNLFAGGLTAFFYEQVMRPDTDAYNFPGRVPTWPIPGLSQIPVLGPALFNGTIFSYGSLIAVAVVTLTLFRTRWGLRTRAVGEHPAAADTVGIRVLGLRYLNVLIAGVVAGFGGAYFSLQSTTGFSKYMVSGAGFIALAAMIFGRWNPVGAFLASLFFGFFGALTSFLTGISSPIPSQFLNMLPYVATIFAVAGLVGRVRAPAADGKPYVKG
ncbi:ABC transporter permease [Catellatospora sp. TT07R-123]|uniref:ABC transporter permease n=1 Tax=Catellatospora sp. TT07R-123 TaxID=2733863 RepID=UPI001B0596CB|nr:ABC transporter permease [Catellatospora sp. TT07R-123]GHJ50338.1 ABC transporter permease [Catellatospora sp. TT07R-123]